jgi:hypothetical protein
MSCIQTQIDYARLQTPREDRTALIEPPLDDVPELVAENVRDRVRLGGYSADICGAGVSPAWAAETAAPQDYDLHGRRLSEVSLQARSELLAAARKWTGAYRNIKADSPILAETKTGAVPLAPIYLAGHQPQLFHPGVWFKNFVLGEAARRDGATAINLIIDGDTLSNAALRMPGGSIDEPYAAQVPFDSANAAIPYEERKIEDRELFASFARRALEQIEPLVPDPLLRQYWPMVQLRARECDNLGACLAQARHQLEAAWGLETLEVPQSWMCRGEAFQWFVAHVLVSLPEFRKVYNESLREYRRQHHVRSHHHPAPDLTEEGAWGEAPFWVWTAADPRRRRLFIQATADETLLSDRQSWDARLHLSPESDAEGAVDQLLELQRSGVRIRPRAMMTTLWVRLALGDLFIHGIGGAKYDCVTDRLIERFFGLTAPRFLVVSATLHLPIAHRRATPDKLLAIQHDLREMTYHPERFLDGANISVFQNQFSGADIPVCQEGRNTGGRQEGLLNCEELIAEKRRWLGTPQTVENAKERCQAIRRINVALQPNLDGPRERLKAQLAEASRRLQAETILASRDYAFCLHPESALREFLSSLLHTSSPFAARL